MYCRPDMEGRADRFEALISRASPESAGPLLACKTGPTDRRCAIKARRLRKGREVQFAASCEQANGRQQNGRGPITATGRSHHTDVPFLQDGFLFSEVRRQQ